MCSTRPQGKLCLAEHLWHLSLAKALKQCTDMEKNEKVSSVVHVCFFGILEAQPIASHELQQLILFQSSFKLSRSWGLHWLRSQKKLVKSRLIHQQVTTHCTWTVALQRDAPPSPVCSCPNWGRVIVDLYTLHRFTVVHRTSCCRLHRFAASPTLPLPQPSGTLAAALLIQVWHGDDKILSWNQK